MRIPNRLAQPEPCFSFEFFAPKTPQGRRNLDQALNDLTTLSPGFISITCSASGSKRQPSLDLMADLSRDTRFHTMAHLTCAGVSRTSLEGDLDFLKAIGVENLLALRGDPPVEEQSSMHPNDMTATDFIQLIRRGGWDFSIGGAAYPEAHPKAVSPEADLDDLASKVVSGAEFLVTQLFFNNGHFYDFVRRARAKGIHVPIVPGIMPITEEGQLERFRTQCGVFIPDAIQRAMERNRGSKEAIHELGVALATRQCLDLMSHGFHHIHFFTLNKSPATRAIVTAIRSTLD